MQPQDGLPAPQTDPVAPALSTDDAPIDAPVDPPDYANPNDLDFEMTPEQEADYVEQILKTGNYEPSEPKTPEPVTPPAPAPTPEAPAAAVVPAPEPAKEDPAPAAELTAPQTDDLWIEVEQVTVDELGDEKTETIKLVFDPSDPSSFIPDDFTAKSTKQLADIMDAKAEMAKLYEERKGDFTAQSAAKAHEAKEAELLASWDQEINDLQKSGVLATPKLSPTDKDYATDPAVVKTNDVYAFMAKENLRRTEAGESPIQSFSLAFTMYENDAKRLADVEAAKQAELNTKKAGAMVGGGSAASGGSPEPKVYKAGSHHNIWSIPVED